VEGVLLGKEMDQRLTRRWDDMVGVDAGDALVQAILVVWSEEKGSRQA
jgi:hypothetical protein